MGSCQAKNLAALFSYIEKTALENVEWLLYYTVPACESKKFSAYVGKTLILIQRIRYNKLRKKKKT